MTLELSGIARPDFPFRHRGKVLAVRAPTNLVAWAEAQVEADHTTMNQFLIGLLEDRRSGGAPFPADVMEWLLAQAAACRRPGDWKHALVETVRDLAKTYPRGCRLPPP